MWYPLTLLFTLVSQIPFSSAINRVIGDQYGSAPYGQWSYLGWMPWTETAHDPGKMTTQITRFLNGTDYTVPPGYESPDFRLPEPGWSAWKENFFGEENRPYRISPMWLQTARYNKYRILDYVYYLGCICTTVFKRLTPLAGCAVLTSRHILTTATSTELVLQRYRNKQTLENILGAWYDQNDELQNSSMYMTPCRIHYHPNYATIDRTNRSHPIPCMHDLSVWAATHRFKGDPYHNIRVIPCKRAASGRYHYTASTPGQLDLLLLVGYQFIWAINRRPAPWFKYVVRTRLQGSEASVCPKSEWGWFHCVPGDKYSKLGFDQGGALHISWENMGYRTDGLIGLNAFSMRLRSIQIMNYFTVLDTHPNIDYYYNAYMGRLPYQYLDYRFYDSQFQAPKLKPWHYIKWRFPNGVHHPLYDVESLWWKK